MRKYGFPTLLTLQDQQLIHKKPPAICSVSIPSTPFFYIKKALADFVYQLKPLLITQRKSFCNCREATSRSPLRSDRLGGAVRFP